MYMMGLWFWMWHANRRFDSGLSEQNIASVTAVDISPEMIIRAQEKFPQDCVSFICGDAETADVGNNFDSIIIYNAFPHFPDPDKLIDRMSSLLKPGGSLTVAHGMSRERIDAHHSGSAHKVSLGLMAAESLAEIFSRALKVTVIISNNEMYQVVGIRA
jgi:demethylmenaquinone methyltransferase/2-methoxy-6-polyprenyl-1,4-benzoquinol methylase